MKKKVMILLPSLRGGGAEKVASQLVNHLNSEYEVLTVLFNNDKPVYSVNTEVIDFKSEPQKGFFGKLGIYKERRSNIKKIKKEFQPDITISFLSSPNILNLITKNVDKTIISIRNYPSRKKNNRIERMVEYILNKIYNKADAIVPVSQAIKDELVLQGADAKKIVTIYNPVNIEGIKELSKESIENSNLFDKSSFNCISVGNLRSVKGQHHLIRIFDKLVKRDNKYKLYILGEGNEHKNLEALIRKHNLENNVFLMGYIENPYKYIAQSDVFLLSSYSEGFPNSMLEAMTLGKPIISTNCLSGPLEILSEHLNAEVPEFDYLKADYGILCPILNEKMNQDYLSRSEEIFLSAILELSTDKELYNFYSEKSIIRSKDFELDIIMDDWVNLINDLISR